MTSQVALELTEAGTEKSQRAATELEKRPVGTMQHGEGSLVPRGEKLDGPGYAGDEPERQQAAIVLGHIQQKTAKLNEPHLMRASDYHLLMNDNTHLARLARN